MTRRSGTRKSHDLGAIPQPRLLPSRHKPGAAKITLIGRRGRGTVKLRSSTERGASVEREYRLNSAELRDSLAYTAGYFAGWNAVSPFVDKADERFELILKTAMLISNALRGVIETRLPNDVGTEAKIRELLYEVLEQTSSDLDNMIERYKGIFDQIPAPTDAPSDLTSWIDAYVRAFKHKVVLISRPAWSGTPFRDEEDCLNTLLDTMTAMLRNGTSPQRLTRETVTEILAKRDGPTAGVTEEMVRYYHRKRLGLTWQEVVERAVRLHEELTAGA